MQAAVTTWVAEAVQDLAFDLEISYWIMLNVHTAFPVASVMLTVTSNGRSAWTTPMAAVGRWPPDRLSVREAVGDGVRQIRSYLA